jgi:8-oxo-dGTP diphosphatase
MAPPFPTVPVTVDILIENLAGDQLVLIQRRDEPPGYAIPGGFVEPGESAAQAAIREAKEETGLDVELIEQFHAYSKSGRDPRGPVCSIVFIAKAIGTPRGGDDAKTAAWFDFKSGMPMPIEMAFDHANILADYKTYKVCAIKPHPHR